MPGLVKSKATVRLEVLGGLEAAPAARHSFYDLYRFAVLVLGYLSYVDEALMAAVGPQALEAGVVSVEGVVAVALRYSIGVHSALL
jgi:hypothetical protein